MVIDSPRWREMAIVNVQEDDTPEDSDLGCGVLNARLMAAAPDLLAACEAFANADCNVDDLTIDSRNVYKTYIDAIDKARAAIAKAKGQR
jgi:hypothetical protein